VNYSSIVRSAVYRHQRTSALLDTPTEGALTSSS